MTCHSSVRACSWSPKVPWLQGLSLHQNRRGVGAGHMHVGRVEVMQYVCDMGNFSFAFHYSITLSKLYAHFPNIFHASIRCDITLESCEVPLFALSSCQRALLICLLSSPSSSTSHAMQTQGKLEANGHFRSSTSISRDRVRGARTSVGRNRHFGFRYKSRAA